MLRGTTSHTLASPGIGHNTTIGYGIQGQEEDGLFGAVLYLMCNELHSFVRSLEDKGVTLKEIQEESWGLVTSMKLPSGGHIGLYQPTHQTALDLEIVE